MKKYCRRKNNDKKNETIFPWKIVYSAFEPSREGLREAICTLGNGYFGTRGVLCGASADGVHYPGTYIAGVYNRLATEISGKRIFNEDLVNCPNWLLIVFYTAGASGDGIKGLERIAQELDIREGVLRRTGILRDASGNETSVSEERIVHINDPHCGAIRYTVTPLNYSGKITLLSGIDGSVENTGVPRYRDLNSRHLCRFRTGAFGRNVIFLSARTSRSCIYISSAAKLKISSGKREIIPEKYAVKENKNSIFQKMEFPVRRNRKYTIEKTVFIYTSKDIEFPRTERTAVYHVERAPSFNVLARTHSARWRRIWEECDVRITGDTFSQAVLRLHAFHLLQTANIHNTFIDAGFPARGLHGEAYRGHIFWDEMFVLPFFEEHLPEVAKAILLYRYRRLKEARKYARKNGYKGAMFPWQSGDSGKEETQVMHLNPMSGKWGPDLSRNQRHISFAIAYNVWRHWIMSGDRAFLYDHGAEILLSIAKFAASLCKYSGRDGKFHTDGLMGPDEFHEKMPGAKKAGLKDNTYSNVMIVWILLRAMEVIEMLPASRRKALKKILGIRKKDINRWKKITAGMKIVMDKNGIMGQFDGYFGLKEIDWKKYRKKYGDIHRLDRILKSEGRSPDDYKVSKQADVLMIFYLLTFDEIHDIFQRLGYRFDTGTMRKNYDYYVVRTSHGSTLSKVVHCYVALIMGKEHAAWDWFGKVLEADIHDTQGGTTPEGIHAGVMGGSIDIAIRGFAGVEVTDKRIKVSPRMPQKWKSAYFSLKWKKRSISFSVKRNHLSIKICGKGPALEFEIKKKIVKLFPGKEYSFKI